MMWKKEAIVEFECWYERKNLFAFHRRLAVVKSLIGKQNNLILDMGTGDGEMLLSLIQTRKTEFGIGLDVSDKLIRAAKNSSKSANLNEKASFIVADGENLPFKDSTFDVVYSAATIEHLPNPSGGMREMARVVKKDGKIIVTTPNPLYDKIYSIAASLGLKYRENHHKPISLSQLRRWLKEFGLKVIFCQGFVAIPFLSRLPISVDLRVSKILTVGSNTLAFNQIVVGVKNITDKSAQESTSFPTSGKDNLV